MYFSWRTLPMWYSSKNVAAEISRPIDPHVMPLMVFRLRNFCCGNHDLQHKDRNLRFCVYSLLQVLAPCSEWDYKLLTVRTHFSLGNLQSKGFNSTISRICCNPNFLYSNDIVFKLTWVHALLILDSLNIAEFSKSAPQLGKNIDTRFMADGIK